MQLKDNKILIIGASGFVGSYLKKSLCEKYRVTFTYTNNSIKGGIFYDSFQSRLLDFEELKDVDIVINCYSPKSDHKLEDICRATNDLIDFIKENDRWLISISSVSSLAENRLESDYSFKKFIIDEMLQFHLKSHRYTILRFAQIFDYVGLGESAQRGLYYLINSIKTRSQIEILQNYESLKRNYIPIDLVVKAVQYCIERQIKGVHNTIIEKHTLNFRELITTLIQSNPYSSEEVKIFIGDKTGMEYFVPHPSEQFEQWASEAGEIGEYFSKIYYEYRKGEKI